MLWMHHEVSLTPQETVTTHDSIDEYGDGEAAVMPVPAQLEGLGVRVHSNTLNGPTKVHVMVDGVSQASLEIPAGQTGSFSLPVPFTSSVAQGAKVSLRFEAPPMTEGFVDLTAMTALRVQ